MFEKYYNKLRFSQKIADRGLITCMKIMENNRNYVLSDMKDKNVHCHKGCNLCCHALTLTVDTLNTYILARVFETIPYDELFPYFKLCVDNRIKAQEYIDTLPSDYNNNIPLEVYNKFGFTVSTCPFVDKQDGCLIHEFRPQMCFTYFSSVPCKITFNPDLNENQKMLYEKFRDKAEIVDISSLENDRKNYSFDDIILETYDNINYKEIMKHDPDLEYFLVHSCSYEMLTIISFALEKSNPEKYENDMKGINFDFLTKIDGEIKYF
jgi:Fe-S-cluster containining protein